MSTCGDTFSEAPTVTCGLTSGHDTIHEGADGALTRRWIRAGHPVEVFLIDTGSEEVYVIADPEDESTAIEAATTAGYGFNYAESMGDDPDVIPASSEVLSATTR